ncbi:Sar s 3 allergen (serine protease-like protein 13) [Sarcoptes scabiei]|uniref:trypsin n=1 Tax=Sarcoptes scabiei TaxID=52283 RepID=A0A132AL78_SARSC|nr:Sar s 3 allergen (serine protease-like protein 13) [Sarcoptes scabiei]
MPSPLKLLNLLFTCFLLIAFFQSSSALIGGRPSNITDEPWTAGLLAQNYFCGGSLIHESFVLTAGQCVCGKTPQEIHIFYNTTTRNRGGDFRDVKQVYCNHYDAGTYKNDIAIVETKTPMEFNNVTSRAIDLADQYFDPNVGSKVLVSGWGDDRPGNENLTAADFFVEDRYYCSKQYMEQGKKMDLKKDVFCAGGKGFGDASLESGDAGDPGVYKNKLIGVATYPPWYKPGLPGIFTNVGFYTSWIKSVIQKKR